MFQEEKKLSSGKTSKPNFFYDTDTLNELAEMELEDREYRDIDFTVDLTDIPYRLAFTSDETSRTMTIYCRGELSVEGFERGTVTIDKESGQGKAEVNQEVPEDYIAPFFATCRKLNQYIQVKQLEKLYEQLDPEKAGILLFIEDGEIKTKVVSGRERPNLMCKTGFFVDEEERMMRPYVDEQTERFMMSMMPWEAKLAMAEDGDEDAMESVATAYLNGDDEVDEDPEQAVYWFRKLAEAGNATAQYNLGVFYAQGTGVERDYEQAIYWLEQAAEHGDEDAPDVIDQIWKKAERSEKAKEDIKKAKAGDAQAQADLARFLMGESDEDEGYEMAFQLAQKSAAQGNADGIYILALAYEKGRGVEKDMEKAVELYKQGADLDHAGCQLNLGVCYMNGEGVKKNKSLAFNWLLKSAQQGNGLAMRNVGWAYQFGHGVQDDMELAIEWYAKAAEAIDDPDIKEELEQRVAVFRHLQDLEENRNNREEDISDLPTGYMEILELVTYAEEHEDFERHDNDDGTFSTDQHIRFVCERADAGDAQAQYLAAKFFLTDPDYPEKYPQEFAKANAWMRLSAEQGNEQAREYLDSHS